MHPDSRSERFAVVGAGRAGCEAIGQLRKQGFAGEVTVVDAAWNPTLVGASEWTGVRRRFGVAAVGLDTGRRRVHLSTSEELAYDGLVIATGCRVPTRCLRMVPLGRTVGAGVPPVRQASRAPVSEPLALLDLAMAEGVPNHDSTHGVGGTRQHAGGAMVAQEAREQIADAGAVVILGAAPSVEWLSGSGALLCAAGVLCESTCRVVGADGVVAVGSAACWRPRLRNSGMLVEHWAPDRRLVASAIGNLLAGSDESHPSRPALWSDDYGRHFQYGSITGRARRPHRRPGSGLCTVTIGDRNFEVRAGRSGQADQHQGERDVTLVG